MSTSAGPRSAHTEVPRSRSAPGWSQPKSSALTFTTSACTISRCILVRTASGSLPSEAPTGPSASIGRMLGSTLTSTRPLTRSTRRAMASQPGGVQLEIDPTCSTAVVPGNAAASSSSVHCQSAAPATWKP